MHLIECLNNDAVKNVLLITGKKSFFKSGAARIISNSEKEIEVTHFNEFAENPRIEDVKVGVDLYKSKKFEAIIAIGGGSVIDMAKLIKYFGNTKKITVDSILAQESSPVETLLYAIPTTAGTGSEVTHFAVVYDGIEKYSVSSNLILPTKVFLCPELLLSQTKYQKIVSGLDAICQAIESYWSINSTFESRKFSSKALELILPNITKVTDEIDDIQIHKKLALGAFYAGKAINISKTTAPHALSYYLTKKFGIPHGHAVAIFLPSFINYNFQFNSRTLSAYNFKKESLEKILLNNIKGSKNERLDFLLYEFITNLGISINPLQLGLTKDEFISSLEHANPERMKNNPRDFKLKDYIEENIDFFKKTIYRSEHNSR